MPPLHAVKNPDPAPVRLALRGFSAQSSVTVEEVASAIEWLPRFHLVGLREIIYSPREPLSYPSLGASSPALSCAEFVQDERAIFVYRTDAPELFRHVLYHEIGHHVFFLVIGSAVKKRWVTQIYPRSRCATQYGYTSAAEDFAECYSLYAQHTRNLEAFPAKLAFMQEDVFSGRPGSLREKNR